MDKRQEYWHKELGYLAESHFGPFVSSTESFSFEKSVVDQKDVVDLEMLASLLLREVSAFDFEPLQDFFDEEDESEKKYEMLTWLDLGLVPAEILTFRLQLFIISKKYSEALHIEENYNTEDAASDRKNVAAFLYLLSTISSLLYSVCDEAIRAVYFDEETNIPPSLLDISKKMNILTSLYEYFSSNKRPISAIEDAKTRSDEPNNTYHAIAAFLEKED